MKKIHFKETCTDRENIVIGVGKFDGIHRGHMEILKTIVTEADRKGLVPAIFTFRNFPAEFLLCEWKEKLRLLEKAGIKLCIWCDLEEISGLSPEKFLDFLVFSGVREIVAGYNFHFGKRRKAGVDFLRNNQKDKKFDLLVVSPLRIGDEIVSSSKIRGFIRKGDVEKANKFMGRYFSIAGKVIKGSGIGHSIGFPTANLSLENNVQIADGVYAGWAEYGGRIYKAAIVAGISPTFEDRIRKFEVLIINLAVKDIYDETIKVFLYKKLREQIKFPDKERLKIRIAEDLKEITGLLRDEPSPPAPK